MMAKLAIAVVVAQATAPPAGDAASWMSGPDIRSTFIGWTLTGAYASGAPFEETYHDDGTLAYAEADIRVSGNWHVAGQDFCTFYADLMGGCFRAVRLSDNCYRFFSTADVAGTAPPDGLTTRFVAEGWTNQRPSTCPAQQNV